LAFAHTREDIVIGSAADVEAGAHLEADIVVVGAGAAGITIAKRLSGKSLRVVVLESGSDHYDADAQSLYEGAIVGQQTDPLDVARLRVFGGTTNHWGGWCRPLEPSDFRPRADWPESGWPIGRPDLNPYYREAVAVCQVGPASFDDVAYWQHQPGGEALIPLAFDALQFQSAVFQISRIRFGEAYRADLEKAPNLRVILDATVLELLPAASSRPDQTRKSVGQVSVTTKGSKTFTVSGRIFVVATGGIESTRLLLLSAKINPTGAGNENDLIGRYFLDHVWMTTAAYLRFSHDGYQAPLYFDQPTVAGAKMFAAISCAPAFIEREQIGAARFVLMPTRISMAGLDSLREVATDLRHGAMPDHLGEHLSNIWSDLYVIADSAYKTITGSKQGWVTLDETAPYKGAFVDLNFEPRPNPDSRVMLDTTTDANGQRRVKLDWRLTDTDRRTATRALDAIAHEFGRLGLGRTRIRLDVGNDRPWPAELKGSDHHSGTARMSETPKSGVVDANCRVHSVQNLYVAGSAVFPTIGYANPTLTIVALALRLADHLERLLA
jgi:choline dehydrogenase-like flavoprotein